jgi:hypothetical protein
LALLNTLHSAAFTSCLNIYSMSALKLRKAREAVDSAPIRSIRRKARSAQSDIEETLCKVCHYSSMCIIWRNYFERRSFPVMCMTSSIVIYQVTYSFHIIKINKLLVVWITLDSEWTVIQSNVPENTPPVGTGNHVHWMCVSSRTRFSP